MVRTFLIIFITFIFYYKVFSQAPPNYPAQVGDIAFDAKLDDPAFKVCDDRNVQQYYSFGKGFQYNGDKPQLKREVLKQWKKLSDVNAMITIRFIVNCEGKSGRFRIQSMDDSYQLIVLSEKVNSQLIQLTRSLSGWIIGTNRERSFDYYQYLTFRVNNGNLIEITP